MNTVGSSAVSLRLWIHGYDRSIPEGAGIFQRPHERPVCRHPPWRLHRTKAQCLRLRYPRYRLFLKISSYVFNMLPNVLCLNPLGLRHRIVKYPAACRRSRFNGDRDRYVSLSRKSDTVAFNKIVLRFYSGILYETCRIKVWIWRFNAPFFFHFSHKPS